MNSRTLICAALIFCFSCNSSSETEQYFVPETLLTWKNEGVKKFELDSITSLNGINSFGYHEEDRLYYFYNYQNNHILFYSDQGVLVRRLMIPKEGPNSIYPGYNTGLLVADRIYVNEPNTFRISVFEDAVDSVILRDKFRYSMDNVHNEYRAGTGPFTMFNTPIYLVGDRLHFVANAFGGLFELKNFMKVGDDFPIHSALVYDIKQKQISAYLPRPESLNEGYRGRGFKFKVSHAYNPEKNTLVYAFGAYPGLIEVGKDNSIQEHAIKSLVVSGFKPFRTRQKPMPREQWIKHEYMSPEISNIVFNEHDGYYHLFVKLGQTEAEHDDPRTHGKRDFAMITLDEDFEIIGEQILSSDYDPNYVHSSEEGLMILRKDLYDLDDNYLSFEIMKPHEN